MLKNIIAGITVGIANVIPGVSGGTMMVLLGIFDEVMEAIPGIISLHNPKRKQHIIFLLQVLIGVAIGLIGFAKVLEYLFNVAPTQTMYWFIGLIAFSIPVFMRNEMSNYKVNWIAFIIGFAIVVGLEILNSGASETVNPIFPTLSLLLMGKMVLIGFIGGFSMFLPGVSGSMVLLILGYYHLFKGYLANVTSFRLDIIIPLGFMAIGVGLGILFSAKILKIALDKNKPATLSFLLGLIVSSTCVLFYQTLSATFDLPLIISSLIAFAFGGFLVYILDRFVR